MSFVQAASAQGVDRAVVIGHVTDASGAAVQGAVVSASSPDLIGVRRVVTDNAGIYRFPDLVPGTYKISTAVPGFKSAWRDGVRLAADATLVVDVNLELASIAESMDVSSNVPIVDVTSVQTPYRISSELLANLPTAHDLSSLMNLAPGVNVNIGLGGVQKSNPIYNDGVNVTSAVNLKPWSTFNYNWVDDVEIVGVAATAEYDDFNGIIQKNRLKSGGNRVTGLGEYRTTRPRWTDTNTSSLSPSLQANFSPSSLQILNWWDTSAQVGGPIQQDRLWFFTGFEAARDNERPALYSGPASTDRNDRRVLTKVDGAISPALRFSAYYEYDKYRQTGVGLDWSRPFEATWTDAQPDHSISARLTWTARHGSVQLEHSDTRGVYYDEPSAPNTRSGPYPHVDQFTGFSSVNVGTYYDEGSDRQASAATIVAGGRTWAGDHQVKAGIHHERDTTTSTSGIPGGRRYIDQNGAPYQVQLESETGQLSEEHRTSAYVQDEWSLARGFTLHPGVRLAINRGIVSQGAVASSIPLSPRVGVAWDLSQDHRTVVRAHTGRYYDALITAQFRLSDDNVPPPAIRAAVTGPDQFVELYRNTPSAYGIDPNLTQEHFDQWVVGIERETWRKTSIAVQYMRRSYKDLVGIVDKGSIYQPVAETDPGPDGSRGTADDGDPITAFRLMNPGNAFYYYTNPPGFYRRYAALQVIGRKRYGSSWQAQASYTWSSSRGNVVNAEGSNGEGPDFGFNGAAADPNRAINADGPMPFDFTHEVKVLGTWRAPWWNGFQVSGVYQYHTGSAWGRTISNDLQFTTFGVRIEPRGTRRTPALNTFDLRIEKSFALNRGTVPKRIGVYADVFNLNNQGIPDVSMRRPVWEFSGVNFGQPQFWSAPRTLNAGLRVTF